MPESNEVLSVNGMLVGMPLATYTGSNGVAVDNTNYVVGMSAPVTYTSTDIVKSIDSRYSLTINAVRCGNIVTLAGYFDPMAVMPITANTDVLAFELKDAFAPAIDVYTTWFPGNGSSNYGGFHINTSGQVFLHQDGTINYQTRCFTATYIVAGGNE